VTYYDALAAGRKVGARNATDVQFMAMFCDSSAQILCGAVSPKLIWEGAMGKSMTAKQLADLMTDNPTAAADLMWS
jgi:hypothetical protein